MPEYTIVNYGGGNPLRCTMRQIGTVAPHTHGEMELDMVLTGQCQVTMGETRKFPLEPLLPFIFLRRIAGTCAS